MGAVLLSNAELNPQVHALMAANLIWDNHGCMPLRPGDEAFLPQLTRYHDSGVDLVSINVGFDAVPPEQTLRVAEYFRRWVLERPESYVLVGSVADIELARRSRRLGVLFDIEGGSALDGRLDRVGKFYDLGVRWMLIAYNRNNLLGGGCSDEDSGLTAFGRQVIDEMARVGMVVCCSHTGFRTTMDVMEHSKNPVIFSHSNPSGMWRHRRNINDEAIKACAATGGVVGINGIGLFLGANDSRTETIVRHIDYVAQLVGPEFVGIGLDYVFDQQELADYLAANPKTFPPAEYGNGLPALVTPEQIPQIAQQLLALGYDEDALRAILGGNHLRLARKVWQ
jgi:membrane dipeptidase